MTPIEELFGFVCLPYRGAVRPVVERNWVMPFGRDASIPYMVGKHKRVWETADDLTYLADTSAGRLMSY